MRLHALIRRSTAALVVTALITTAYSLSVAQDVPAKDKWRVVEPMLLPVDIVGKNIEIKVGSSYKFVEYDATEQVKLGVDYAWRPREADAKRVLVIYDISKFSAKDWKSIDEATPPDKAPPLAALLMAVEKDVYIGTPIKWNNQLGEVMRAAVSLEEDFPAIKASAALKVLADDILSHAANYQAMQAITGKATGKIRDVTLSNFKRAGIKYDSVAMAWTSDELQLMMAGNPAPIMAKEPKKPIYMAFNQEFENLSVKPLGKIISVSGVGGERLGYDHPAWPDEKSD